MVLDRFFRLSFYEFVNFEFFDSVSVSISRSLSLSRERASGAAVAVFFATAVTRG
jgi:hypothetical protein